jgi:hypothetical protein
LRFFLEKKEKQLERIRTMEERLNRASQAVMRLSAAFDDYVGEQGDIRTLEAYYTSDDWKHDFADDEAGRLPKDLRRGVLSEDAVWNLLEDCRDLDKRINEYNLASTK